MTVADEIAQDCGGDYGSFTSCVGANYTFIKILKNGENTFKILNFTTGKFLIENAINENVHANIHYVELPNKKYAFLDSLTGKVIGSGKILSSSDFNTFTHLSDIKDNYIETFFKFSPKTFVNPKNKEFLNNCLKVLKAELKANYKWWKTEIYRYLPKEGYSAMFNFKSEEECKYYIAEVSRKIKEKLIECGFINEKSVKDQSVDEIMDNIF